MNPSPISLLQFWGKTSRAGTAESSFHPAIFHMIDVACVAESLLRDGPPRVRQAIVTAWQGANTNLLLAWLPFLIAIHDLGKISAAFQGQDETQRARLMKAGIHFNQKVVKLYHADISACWLHDQLKHHEEGISDELVWILRDAMGGHHGRFTEAGMIDIRKQLNYSERGEDRWKEWRAQTYQLLRKFLAPENTTLACIGKPKAIRAATIVLTGLTVWCDWIGSNERDFPPKSNGMDVKEYLTLSRQQAEKALQNHHLKFNRAPPDYSTFQKLFPETKPRPLQEVIDQVPIESLGQPLLAIIEAPTGEGKTEAALALARRIAAVQGVDELFFALPTMATGNQMFTRLEQFYRTLYGTSGSVRLTHSQSIVVEEELRRQIELYNDQDHFDPNGSSSGTALEWFVGPKKAMLAPFGVGTIDQVELGGLNVRHYPLRLFGLAGKVVIIDEVHAYDTYMNVIIDHTLTWLSTLGCSVILLSATLPQQRHHELAKAFLSGRNAVHNSQLQMPYPLLAIYSQNQTEQYTFGVFRQEQSFKLQLRPLHNPAGEAQRLVELVSSGGAVARICNRVDDAQAIYQELRNLTNGTCILLHARFPLHERQRREQQIGLLLGKASQRKTSEPIIIVGTQILEQSLDYDVDVMISDFAPIDLLLQRAGRLHRHQRARPEPHREAVLEVAVPFDNQHKPEWRRWGAIYEPYILWRSFVALDGSTNNERIVSLPQDYRPLIENVYSDEPIEGRYADEIAKVKVDYQKTLDTQRAKARQPLIPSPLGKGAIVEDGGRPFIDDESGEAANWQLAKTRLGDQVSLVPVYMIDGEFSLDEGGTYRIPTDVPPTLDQMKDLLTHAVPISDRAIIAAYRDERRPRELRWPWHDIPSPLRSMHPLPLDRQTHSFTINRRRLRLDRDLGLVIEKEDGTKNWPEEDV
ncbi:CRISPR-associated helicase Cas3' [Chloroflexus sp.]|uniref:CRISPR-associated helicase Cas3' n=1 Tax=Chloroflexus sp. TaxID=1904827 RepID=UPI00298EDD06|nr:CRISPR-associated helicase Cas3' [Chloroflexus sp.]MDW8404834.1 CRISPR-associated helicase Cas3' [Chloroflexus sp.]